jgi:hypothetical protein
MAAIRSRAAKGKARIKRAYRISELRSNYRSQVPTTRGLLPVRIKRLNIRTMSKFLLSPVFPLRCEIAFTKSLAVLSIEHAPRLRYRQIPARPPWESMSEPHGN